MQEERGRSNFPVTPSSVRSPELRRVPAAAAGLALVLVVVLASAAIRLNATGVEPMLATSGLGALRAVHRVSASLEVLAALWLAWQGWRGRVSWPAVAIVLGLTVCLSLLGIVAGKTPTPVQSLGNLLGGLALAVAFAWILGKKGSGTFFGRPGYRQAQKRFLTPFFLLVTLQSVIGGRLSIFSRIELPALPLHALLGIAIAAVCGWLALARIGGGLGRLLFGLALATPVAGFTALEHPYSAVPALVHAASVALFMATAAFALGRNA